MAGTVARDLLADVLRQPPDQSPHCQGLPALSPHEKHQGSGLKQRAQAGYLKPRDAGGVQRERELQAPDSWKDGGLGSVSGVSPLPSHADPLGA